MVTYIVWTVNAIIILILFIIFLKRRRIRKKLPGTGVYKNEKPKKVQKKKIMPLGNDEKKIISKLAVFGGYSGIPQEKLQGLTGTDSNDLSRILNDLEIKDIINQRLSNSEKIILCKWAHPLLKDM